MDEWPQTNETLLLPGQGKKPGTSGGPAKDGSRPPFVHDEWALMTRDLLDVFDPAAITDVWTTLKSRGATIWFTEWNCYYIVRQSGAHVYWEDNTNLDHYQEHLSSALEFARFHMIDRRMSLPGNGPDISN